MTFPKSDRVVYEADTLNQVVVCQLRFPPILSIGTEPPAAFQERVRGSYPLYSQVDAIQAPPEIAQLLARLPVRPPQTVTHRFTTEDETRSISLGPEFIAITELSYDEWPAFRPEIELAKAALEDVYRPSFYTRVGLRYEDVIDRDALGLERPWADLFNPTLNGLLAAQEPEISGAIREIVGTTVISLDGAEEASVRLSHGLAQAEDDAKQVYLIDADYFSETNRQGGDVIDLLVYFNSEAGNLFRWAISPTLREALGRR